MSKANVWQFYQDGEWYVGMNTINHRLNTEDAGYPVRDLYTTNHAEELAKALEQVDNFLQVLSKGESVNGPQINRVALISERALTNYREATKE